MALYRGSREPVSQLAERFGVSRRTVYNILDRAETPQPPDAAEAEQMLLTYHRVRAFGASEVAALVAGVVAGLGDREMLATLVAPEAFAQVLGEIHQVTFLGTEVPMLVGAALGRRRGLAVLREADLDRGDVHTALVAARDLNLPVVALVLGDMSRLAGWAAPCVAADSHNPLSVRDAIASVDCAGLGFIAAEPRLPADAFPGLLRESGVLTATQIRAIEAQAAPTSSDGPRD